MSHARKAQFRYRKRQKIKKTKKVDNIWRGKSYKKHGRLISELRDVIGNEND